MKMFKTAPLLALLLLAVVNPALANNGAPENTTEVGTGENDAANTDTNTGTQTGTGTGQGNPGAPVGEGSASAGNGPAGPLPAVGSSGSGLNDPAYITVRYLKAAYQSGQREVALSQLAAAQAQSASVKEYAARLVTEHTQVNSQLQALLQSAGVQASACEDNTDLLNALSGAANFDIQYLRIMKNEHQAAVNKSAAYAIRGRDEQVRSFALSVLPVLQQHYLSAVQLLAPAAAGSPDTGSPDTGTDNGTGTEGTEGSNGPVTDNGADSTCPPDSGAPEESADTVEDPVLF